jgi:hypothetical protein
MHISIMTGKLEGLRAVSTNTITNPFCVRQNACGIADNICTKCYSHTMLKSYRKNMQPALERNSVLLSSRVLALSEIPFLNDAILRVNAHGELINETHLVNIVQIANANPHCIVTLWTKRKDIITKYFDANNKPKNLILIFSNSKINNIMPKPPKYFDKTFNNVAADLFVDRQNCTGQKCRDCRLCYSHNSVDTIVEKVKKY